MKSKKRRVALIICLSLLLTPLSTQDDTFYHEVIISEEVKVFTYSKGNIYIGKRKDVIPLKNQLNKGDLIVIDERNNHDPNIEIFNSYQIIDSNIQKEILEILMTYEKENRSAWDRSINSMMNEWYIHNVLYYLNYKRSHTEHVDLNNKDENVYKDTFIHTLKKTYHK